MPASRGYTTVVPILTVTEPTNPIANGGCFFLQSWRGTYKCHGRGLSCLSRVLHWRNGLQVLVSLELHYHYLTPIQLVIQPVGGHQYPPSQSSALPHNGAWVWRGWEQHTVHSSIVHIYPSTWTRQCGVDRRTNERMK